MLLLFNHKNKQTRRQGNYFLNFGARETDVNVGVGKGGAKLANTQAECGHVPECVLFDLISGAISTQ